MNAELIEKLQKFIKLFIEDMDAEHLGSLLTDSNLRWNELQMFLNHKNTLTDEDRKAYEIFLDSLGY